jgi:hypothetical protein
MGRKVVEQVEIGGFIVEMGEPISKVPGPGPELTPDAGH